MPDCYPAPPSFPQGTLLIAPAERLDWVHVGRRLVPLTLTAPEVWTRVMSRPLPGMGLAFWLRDAISSWFGVRRIGGFSRRPQVPVLGGRLDFFTVEAVSDRVLALTERDRHLEVMACITATPAPGGTDVAITGSVRLRSAFGRVYMIPVGPAHRLIVWLMLRRL